jgi:hypothetical protein
VPVGAKIASTDFQGYINNSLNVSLDDLATADLDNLLIYCCSEGEHVEHVK